MCVCIYIYTCCQYWLAPVCVLWPQNRGQILDPKMGVRSEGRQKACRPTAPKMGPRRSASQRNVSKGAGMPVLFCSKHDCHKQREDMRTASSSVQDPGRNPPHPQISKLTYFRILQSYTRKGSKTSFCEWQRWFLGRGAMFARAYPHTSRGSSVKLAIRIGLAAKLLIKHVFKSY